MLLPKNVVYDKKSKSMYVWEFDTQTKRTTKRKCDFDNVYFVQSQEPTEWKDIYGNYMRKEILSPKAYAGNELKKYRERGQKTCELSYDLESKFMLWRYGEQEIVKELAEQGFHNVFKVGFLDIEISATAEFPDPTKALYPVNLITIGNSRFDMTFGLFPYTGEMVKNYHYIEDERKLLEAFFSYIGTAGIDMLSGWNSDGFDIPYLLNRYANLNPDCVVSDDDYEKVLKISGLPMGFARWSYRQQRWVIPGLALVDYMKIYDQFRFDPHESMSLDYVCKKNIGKGKLEYEGSIYDFWKEDWNRFVDYNAVDRIILVELDADQKFLELYATFSFSSLIPFHRCDSSIAQIEGYIIKYLHQKGMVLTDTPQGKQEEFEGAYVMANKGKYKNCISFDATSLYPSIIIQWNISPETKILNPTGDTSGYISTVRPNQFYKKDTVGIVPEIVEDIFNLRKKWKDEYNKSKKTDNRAYTSYCYNLQLNYKILANSFYGVLGHRSFVFYDLDNASLIPLHGQHIIKHFGNLAHFIFDKMTVRQWNKLFPEYELTESQFNEARVSYRAKGLILQDTDSFYLTLDAFYKYHRVKGDKKADEEKFLVFAHAMIDRLYDRYNKIKAKEWSDQFNVNQYRIHFKREKVMTGLIVFAKKKYACYVKDSEGKVFEDPEFEVTGLEIKRTDTSPLVRDFARQAIDWIFDDKSYGYVNDQLCALRERFELIGAKSVDEISLRKGVRDYDKYAYVGGQHINCFKELLPHTPMQNRLSMYYNVIKKELGVELPDVRNGAKIRYVFVKNNKNKWGVDGIAWTEGSYPEQFSKSFEIDYDTLFEKSIMGVVRRLFDAVGWSEPSLLNNTLF